MVKKLVLYNKKNSKELSTNSIELDLIDLEEFSNFKKPDDFFNIANSKINKKSILEWFALDDISYWWFFVPILSPKYDEAISFIDKLLTVITYHNPEKIELQGLFDKKDLVFQICKNSNVQLHYSFIKFIKFKIKHIIKNSLRKIAYGKITKTKNKKRLKRLENKKFNIPRKNFVIFTSHQGYRRESLDLESGKSKQEEHVIQPILDMCNDENILTLCFDFDYTLKGRTDVLDERLLSKYNWIPIEFLLEKNRKPETIKKFSQLHDSIINLTKKDLSSILKYKNISIWNFLKPTFHEFLLEPHLPTYLHLISSLEDFLIKNKPESIIQLYEAGPFAKSFEVVAKKLGIKTIGIQHGNMISDQTDYMHKEIQSDELVLGNPIPDQTFVYGEFHKKLLTLEGHYPNENIVITGNPSLSKIDQIISKINRNTILKKYNILNKKIILIPLSYRIGYDNYRNYDSILLKNVYEKYKNNSEVSILLRPHPGDKNPQKKLDKLYPDNNFIFSKFSLYEDIIACDLIILTISSVGLDAILFDKPVIFVKIANLNEFVTFKKIKALLLQYDLAKFVEPSEIHQVISNFIKFDYKKPNNENRLKFLKHFFNYGEEINFKKLILSKN